MYQDAGYGENWQPADNNARRIDPFTRSCVLLACLFTIGFLLIVIIVLSLIPIYMSKNSSSSTTKTNYRQVSKISINDFMLAFDPSSNDSNLDIIFSNSNNLLALQASLTSLLQTDSILTGSVIDIVEVSKSNRTLDINVIGNTSCLTNRCLTLFQQHAIKQMTFHNQTTTIIQYEVENSNNNTKESFWINYQLPQDISTNASFVNIDPTTLSSLLEKLLLINKNINQLSNN